MKSLVGARLRMSIALLACFTGSAHAQSGLTLYGLLDTGMTYISNEAGHSNVEVNGDGAAPSRVGLRGAEDLGGGLSALFVLEMRPQIPTGGSLSPFWNRGSFVGLRSATWGTLTMGRQFDFMNSAMPPDSTSIIQGGAVGGYQGFSSTKPGQPAPAVDNHSGTGLYNNTVKWENTVGSWSGGLMYGFGADNNHDSMESVYLKYVANGLQLGAGYTRDNFSTTVIANEVYSLRAVYAVGGFLFLANYAQGRETVFAGSKAEARPLELAVVYTLTPAISVGGGIGWARDKNRAGDSANITQPFVGGRYALSKRTFLYAVAALNHSSNPAAIPSTVGIPGGAMIVSSSASQLALRTGIVTRF